MDVARNQKEDSDTAISNSWVLKKMYLQLKSVLCHLVHHCIKVLDSNWYLAFMENQYNTF